MSKPTVLFLCKDNALLGPLAEAYLNRQARGLVRSFSAGLAPAETLHPNVCRLLSVRGLPTEGLEPKSLEVFAMPHAPLPDRLIVLDGCAVPDLLDNWQGQVVLNSWNVAVGVDYPRSFAAAEEYFRRIRMAVDRVLDPQAETVRVEDVSATPAPSVRGRRYWVEVPSAQVA